MEGRFSAFCMVGVMLLTVVAAPFAASTNSEQETTIIIEEIINLGPREYPNDWTHRPVVEVFTSLSCSPCMSNSEPQTISMYETLKEDNSQPFTVITFHQTNGGAGDDPTASQEAKDRYNYYSPIGTPDGEIDGGYIQSQDLLASAEEAGERDVAPTTLNVTQTYNGEGAFTVTATLTYIGEGFNPDFTDPTGIPQDLIDGDTLDYEVQLFMIEHNVYAFSSEHAGMVVTPMVYRGNAGEAATGSLDAGEEAVIMAEWAIPSEIEHPSGHVTPGVQPMDPMVVPGNIEVVAVVYDQNDEAKSSSPNPKQGLIRAINSATPRSTAFDAENEMPTVVLVEETMVDGNANIMAFFDDEDGIGTASVFYNYEGANYTGEWFSQSLEIQGTEICDEEGVCYAYGDASGIGTIPVVEDKAIYYQLAFADGKQNYNTHEVKAFADGSIVAPATMGINFVLIGAISIIVLACGAFTIWARMPYTGTYFD
jgi:hypothetical protein